MPYACVRGPPSTYVGALPAFATFSMHTYAVTQKPEFSLLLLSHFIFLSHMFLFKFLWYARLGFHLLFFSLIPRTCIHMSCMMPSVLSYCKVSKGKSYIHIHMHMCCYVLFDEHVHVLLFFILCSIDKWCPGAMIKLLPYIRHDRVFYMLDEF